MKQIAIIGATASGKTAIAIQLAQKYNSYILSLDSLSIYKEVDIVSAKPTKKERAGIPHFGIDEIYIDEKFSVVRFFDIYKKAKEACERDGKNLIIVGGSSFYLKSMIDGLSQKRKISDEIKVLVKEKSKNLDKAYSFIKQNDTIYAEKISKTDRYRIEKWYEIYLIHHQIATEYFLKNPKKSIINPMQIKIYNIDIKKEELVKKISLRTKNMLKNGLIDEIYFLEKKYGREPIAMGAIGVKETLKYLDGRLKIGALEEEITLHTIQLAKRQITFNKTQFILENIDIKDILNKNTNFLF